MEDKKLVRALARRRLAGLSASERRYYSSRIFAKFTASLALRRTGALFIYVSTKVEVDTHDLIDHYRAAGCTVLVPLLVSATEMHAVRFPGWAAMRTGALGILTPPPGPAWAGPIDTVAVPGLAFTAEGDRLGYGRGYYDRWLTTQDYGQAVALAFETQLFDALPTDSHDVSVARIITESRSITRLKNTTSKL